MRGSRDRQFRLGVGGNGEFGLFTKMPARGDGVVQFGGMTGDSVELCSGPA